MNPPTTSRAQQQRRASLRPDPAHDQIADVADLCARRAEQDRHARLVLTDGIDAAVDAFYQWAGEGRDVRLVVVAMHGDPYAGDVERPDDGHSVPVEARFFCLNDAEPLDERQRRYLALETMRVASHDLFEHVHRGLTLSNAIDDLSEAAEMGDQQAERVLSEISGVLQ
ncbi:MAG: hypothetical protein JWQ20_1351 [Conexibacter sp.]|nr:hypothetical protein [Conexibacter sp.]